MTYEEHCAKIDGCAYKEQEKCTEEETQVRYFERQLCTRSFPRFLRWCRIVEAPTPTSAGGIIKLELWPHIRKLAAAILKYRLISVLKSRQIGASWLIAAYVLWYALSHYGANILLFSKGEAEAAELLNKCRRIFHHLPPFFKVKVDPDSSTEMGFPVLESSVKALAATETAGISFTASVVVCDEHEEHPYAEANYMSAKPTIDAGGQFISIFTVNKSKSDTLAKNLFRGAVGNGYQKVEQGNGFHPMFFAYDVRPGRDEAWYERTKSQIPGSELGGLTPDLYMEQNYPRSVDEALRPSQSVCAFEIPILDDMLKDTKASILREGIDPKICHVYKDYHIGGRYIAATDTSHGKNLDFAVTALMDVRTGEVIGDVFSNRLDPDELAYHSVKLLELFHSPLWYIETNDWGQMTLNKAQELGYRHLGTTKDKRNVRSLGFRTGPNNRPILWGELIPAINDRLITIYNADGLKQFMEVIRTSEGRIEAIQGGHDDYPMAVGLAWLKKDEVALRPATYKPIATLTWSNR